jgi:uncharacterized repeat protein (TIGR03803 family)
MPRATLRQCLLLLVIGFLFNQQAQSQEYRILHTFRGDSSGGYPGALMIDPTGNLYGTTGSGGTLNTGTIFKLAKKSNLTTIYEFTGNPDGVAPSGMLLRDSSDDIYGTTIGGGGTAYAGTVYRLDTLGKESVLYSFAGTPDAANPYYGVVRDLNGTLYGTTTYGGVIGAGTVFKVDSNGNETVLHSFGIGSEGQYPQGPVIRDSDGNLYGLVPNAAAGGSVYKIDAMGTFTVLYTFKGEPDGSSPIGSLYRDHEGNLYGTTAFGGKFASGTVFKLDTAGNETVLYSFAGGTDGALPIAGVIQDSSGNLYGTTQLGGPSNQGTVFKLAHSGQETVLHYFSGGEDGLAPMVGLVRDSRGNLYGSTQYGGAYNAGVVFKLESLSASPQR